MNTFILEKVGETCIKILKLNQSFREKTVATIKDFFNSPDKRTIDAVPSVELMLLHILCFSKMKDYKKYFGEEFTFDKARMTYIFRFAIEEILRRE